MTEVRTVYSPWGATPGEELRFTYKNHRGETGTRHVRVLATPRYGKTQWHSEMGWLLPAYDLDKHLEREFAMAEIKDLERLHPPAWVRSTLTFAEMREANATRQGQLFPDCANWTLSAWANATGGEIGEMLIELGGLLSMLNTAKKLDRDGSNEELRQRLGRELADIVLYCDITAARANLDLATCVSETFNALSSKRECDVRLPLVKPPPPSRND